MPTSDFASAGIFPGMECDGPVSVSSYRLESEIASVLFDADGHSEECATQYLEDLTKASWTQYRIHAGLETTWLQSVAPPVND